LAGSPPAEDGDVAGVADLFRKVGGVVDELLPRSNGTAENSAARVAPASPIWLVLRYNSVNVLFWLQIRHKHTLIMPPYQTEKKGWRQRNVFLNESSFKKGKSDIRQGTTDRGSAGIANLVAVEVQYRQRVILAANQTQRHLDNTHYQSIQKIRVVPRRNVFS
jgi:hypothetical protein